MGGHLSAVSIEAVSPIHDRVRMYVLFANLLLFPQAMSSRVVTAGLGQRVNGFYFVQKPILQVI